MKVRFTMGPHAGETRHVEKNELIQLFIDCGLLEFVPQLVESKPAASYGPQFCVIKANPFRPDQYSIQCKRAGGREVLFYDGHPDYAADYFKQIGAVCPAEIVQQYKLVWKQPLDADGIATRKFSPPQSTQLELEAQRRQQVRPATIPAATGEAEYTLADPANGGGLCSTRA